MPLARSSRCFTVVAILSFSSSGRPHCRMSTRSSAGLRITHRAKTPNWLFISMPARASSTGSPACAAPPSSASPSTSAENRMAGSGAMGCVVSAPPPAAPSSPSVWYSGFALRSSSTSVEFSLSIEFMYGKQRTVRSLHEMFSDLRCLLTHMSWKRCETPLSSHRFSLRFSVAHVLFSARWAPRCMHPFAWIWLSLRSSVCTQ
mmetsp:Transcript_58564/g.154236  ORF Transcript_58564/g.154236 Transcript_58564/m.154236 type:complete len:203 (-) Transcript_58564:919-1527(-)